MKVRIDIEIQEEVIINLIAIWLSFEEEQKPNKKAIKQFIKDQIRMYGTEDVIGENFMTDHGHNTDKAKVIYDCFFR